MTEDQLKNIVKLIIHIEMGNMAIEDLLNMLLTKEERQKVNAELVYLDFEKLLVPWLEEVF